MIHATTGLPIPPPELGEEAGKWSVLLTYRGSVAHGMWLPGTDPNSFDDVDLQAITVPPPAYYIGFKGFGSKGTLTIQQGHWDIVYYEAVKAMRLLMAGNANLLTMLWVEPGHILKHTEAGDLLLAYRDLFLSKQMYRPLEGYAHGQMEDMKKSVFKGYMGDRRKNMVDRFGFDPKAAAHTIRLLRMGITAFQEGYFEVYRHRDADELMAIKRGEWSKDHVLALADKLFDDLRTAKDESSLPEIPDHDLIDMLCETIIRTTWAERGEMP